MPASSASRARISVSSIGRIASAPGGIGTPCARSQAARVATAAPYIRFMATATVRRLSGRSRQLPRAHSLKAPMAGPHQIW